MTAKLCPDDAKIVQDVRKAFPYFRIEDERADVIGHSTEVLAPATVATMGAQDSLSFYAKQVSPYTSTEDLLQLRSLYENFDKENWERITSEHPEYEKYGYWKEYEVPGCPEEVDAPPVTVLVWHIKESYRKGPHPVVMPIAIGGLFTSDPWAFANASVAKYLRCQLVIPKVRTYPEAQYPAAINDLHATYQWMAANADELGFDMDGVVIEGVGSGGHLAAALPFRLKKYNWCGAPMPRGVVVYDGFFDDRETTRSSRTINTGWSGVVARAANMRYMGMNFASSFIGPDAYANHATLEECIGLPPYAIYTNQEHPSCEHAMEFRQKLSDVGNYVHLHIESSLTDLTGAEVTNRVGGFATAENAGYKPQLGIDVLSRMESAFIGCIKEFLDYDVRRAYD